MAARQVTDDGRKMRTAVGQLIEALAVVADTDADMTIGRLQALLAIAYYNSGPEGERLTQKKLWEAMGGDSYCAHGSFNHQLKMLSTRKVKDAHGNPKQMLGLIEIRRGEVDYRGTYPVLTPPGKRLVAHLVAKFCGS